MCVCVYVCVCSLWLTTPVLINTPHAHTAHSTDLKTFFKNEVPKAQAGDDVVSKFVGDDGDKSAQTEVRLLHNTQTYTHPHTHTLRP